MTEKAKQLQLVSYPQANNVQIDIIGKKIDTKN